MLLGDVVAALETRYDPALAESWDAVGLVCGDPGEPVRRVLFAVDPTTAVVDEVIATGADLLVTHHPLLLTAVHGVPADDPKGRLVHRLIRGGRGPVRRPHQCRPGSRPGVNDALAAVLGLRGRRSPGTGADDPRAGLGRVGRLASADDPAAVRRARRRRPSGHGRRRPGRGGSRPRGAARWPSAGAAAARCCGPPRAAGADVLLTSDLSIIRFRNRVSRRARPV